MRMSINKDEFSHHEIIINDDHSVHIAALNGVCGNSTEAAVLFYSMLSKGEKYDGYSKRKHNSFTISIQA
jgi:hypothetical protein